MAMTASPGAPPEADDHGGAFDEGSIIEMIQTLITPDAGDEEAGDDAAPAADKVSLSLEMLWDLSASASFAKLMTDNLAIKVLEGLFLNQLNKEAPDYRLVELALGTLANIASHAETSVLFADEPDLVQLLAETVLLCVDDSAALAELMRLFTAGVKSPLIGDSWLRALAGRDTLDRCVWIATQTLNPTLLARSHALLAELAAAGGGQSLLAALLDAGYLDALGSGLDAYAANLRAAAAAASAG